MEQWPLTPKQAEFLELVDRMTRERGGIGPSERELAAALHISQTAVVSLIKRLTARGHVQRIPKTARTLRIIKPEGATAAQ
jgi:DNA-binding MarR family transcriptional regulator